jgi:hypothetical protein
MMFAGSDLTHFESELSVLFVHVEAALDSILEIHPSDLKRAATYLAVNLMLAGYKRSYIERADPNRVTAMAEVLEAVKLLLVAIE